MTTQILIVGRQIKKIKNLVDEINKSENWIAAGTISDKKAIQLFNAFNFDVVLLNSGITEFCENSLWAYFTAEKPTVKIIHHFEEYSGLLSNEILLA